MAKLTKEEAKQHNKALEMVKSGMPLTFDEKLFILDNYQEGATNINNLAGAFFTPHGLARDFSIEVFECNKIIDLCAGIGRLAFQVKDKAKHITCIEINPEYIEVGRSLLPEANWIMADALMIDETEQYDIAISNPPFGKIKTSEWRGKYRGPEFEYKIIEKSSRIAKYGAFIIPQFSSPFKYSGETSGYSDQKSNKYIKFSNETNIELVPNCGIDTSLYLDDWHGVSPICEIVLADF